MKPHARGAVDRQDAFGFQDRACDPPVDGIDGALPDPLQRLLAAHTLLSSPAATEAPERDLMTHCLDGSLTAAKLDKLLPAAATTAMVNAYRAQLAAGAEHTLVGEWHRQTESGGADQILDSLRPSFDKHAEAIAKARSLIDPESSAEHILAAAAPEMVEAWQTLDGHIRVISKIAAIASQFGPRLGGSPQTPNLLVCV